MICPNCGSLHALSDNFCRRCGWNLSGSQVPMVIENKRALATWQPERALAVGGVASVALGALAWLAKRWLARRAVTTVASRLPSLIRQPQPPVKQNSAEEFEEGQVHIETFLWVRRVRFRR